MTNENDTMKSEHQDSENPMYSDTWLAQTDRSRASLPHVTVDNFYLTSAFSGFYEKPSPFPSFQWRRVGKGLPVFEFLRYWLMVLRHARVFRRKLLKDIIANPLFSTLVPYLPPADPDKRLSYFTPFYYNYQGKKFNGTFLKCAEQLYAIEQVVPKEQLRFVCEIGGGFGAMAEIIIKKHRPQLYCIIDLPETLEVASLYLSSIFPDSVQHYVTGQQPNIISGETSIILVPAEEAERIREFAPQIGLFINSDSFSEMHFSIVQRYFTLMEKYPGTYLSNANPARWEGDTLYAGPETYPYSERWKFVMKARQRIPYYNTTYQMISHLRV